MMMMNIAAFAIALHRVLRRRASPSSSVASAPVANLGGLAPLSGIFGHGSAGLIGLHGFFLQSGHGYDVGVIALFLFQVVFMETAGYIIIGAIAERISFAGFILAEVAMGAIIYPIYGNWVWGGGWLAHLGQTPALGPRRGRLRRLRRRARHRRLGGPGAGHDARPPDRQVQRGRHAERDSRATTSATSSSAR